MYIVILKFNNYISRKKDLEPIAYQIDAVYIYAKL